MKKVLTIMLVLMIAFGVMGCSNSKEITKDDIKVKDGEKFFGSIYYPSMVMFNNILYTGTYYSGDMKDLSVVGRIESCIDDGLPSENNQANDPFVGCEIYTTSSAPDFIFVLNNGIYSSYKSADGAGIE